METKKSINSFAVTLLGALIPANVLHLGWTIWLSMEQAETGWDGGTGIEMLALLPWFLELLCLPVILLSAVYFVLSCFRKQKRGLLAANICLFMGLLLQIVLTNLFMFF